MPRSRTWERWVALLRWTLSSDPLPPTGDPLPPRTASPGRFLAWLFAPEPPPGRAGTAPAPPRPRGFARWLFAPEPFPTAPEAPPNEGPGLLRWLFTPERMPGPSRPNEVRAHGPQ